jgi:hypothetical protein
MRLPSFLQNIPRIVLLAVFVSVVAYLTLWFHLMLASPTVLRLQAESDVLRELPPAVNFTLDISRRLSALILPLGAIIGVFSALSIWRGAPEKSQRAVRIGLIVLALILTPLGGWISVCSFIGAQNLAISERQRSLIASHALQDLAALGSAASSDLAVFQRAVHVHRQLQAGPARELRLLTVDQPAQLPLIEQHIRAISLIQWLEMTSEPGLRRALLAASLSWRTAYEGMRAAEADRQSPVERLLQHARRDLPEQDFPSGDAWFDWLEQQNRDQTDWSRPPVLRLAPAPDGTDIE